MSPNNIMIISHEHKYVFLELPHTGTRSVHRDLIEHHGGEEILSHHSNYYEFLKVAKKYERQYFVFSAIRNPLDLVVSQYFKLLRNTQQEVVSESRRRRLQSKTRFNQRVSQLQNLAGLGQGSAAQSAQFASNLGTQEANVFGQRGGIQGNAILAAAAAESGGLRPAFHIAPTQTTSGSSGGFNLSGALGGALGGFRSTSGESTSQRIQGVLGGALSGGFF